MQSFQFFKTLSLDKFLKEKQSIMSRDCLSWMNRSFQHSETDPDSHSSSSSDSDDDEDYELSRTIFQKYESQLEDSNRIGENNSGIPVFEDKRVIPINNELNYNPPSIKDCDIYFDNEEELENKTIELFAKVKGFIPDAIEEEMKLIKFGKLSKYH